MLTKTRGVVLHLIDYSDNSLVAHIYTESYGIQAYLIQGAKKPRNPIRVNQLQPLHLLDMIVYHKEASSLQRIKEISTRPVLHSIPTNFIKRSIALFLNEMLYKVLRQQGSDPRIFQYLTEAIIWLEQSKSSLANYPLSFLIQLSRFLGFFPQPQKPKTFFDLVEGVYTDIEPIHPNYLDQYQAEIFIFFGSASFEQACHLTIPKDLRKNLLDTTLEYYAIHLANVGEIKSLLILEEVLS